MTTRPLALALLLAVVAPAALRAQDGNPLARPPAWAGAFADATVRVELHPLPTEADGTTPFDGTIAVKGSPYRAKGVCTSERLAGTFTAGGKDYEFVATLDGADTLVLVSARTTYRLAREAPPQQQEKPAPVEAPGAPRRGPDLSHVRVGQTYAFAMQNNLEMRYEVREVADGLVRYTIQTYMDMGKGLQKIGDPQAQEYRWDGQAPTPTQSAPPGASVRRETVTVGAEQFDCMVVESGDLRSWIPMTGDVPTFPLIVRARQGETTVFELVRIEEP